MDQSLFASSPQLFAGCHVLHRLCKGVSLSKAINIIENGLRVSLDEESKDELTQNLIALYSYMVRRLLQANLRNDVSAVEEVEALMRNIADAWKESLLSPSLIQDPV